MRRALAWRIAVNVFFILVVSMFVGSYILDFFGLSLPIVQVGGGLANRRIGFAFASQPTSASYTPGAGSALNSSGGAITVTRSSVGHYAINFAGLQKLPGHTEHVQVTSFGMTLSTCTSST